MSCSCGYHTLAALTRHLVGMWIKVDKRDSGVHRNWRSFIGMLMWKRTRNLMQVSLITDFPYARFHGLPTHCCRSSNGCVRVK